VAFQDYLLTVDHPDRCSDDEIVKHCTVFALICTTLDTISSKSRIKFQEPGDEDYDILQKALQNLDNLWKNAGLSYTPKLHSVLVHNIKQMRECQGIGDMLEDDVADIHQLAAKIESRTSRMKEKFRQAFVHSKIVAIQNCHEIKSKLVLSKEDAKRNFKKGNMDLDSEQRKSKLKLERNSSRLETLQLLLEKPDSSLPTIKFKTTR
jgi:hypothetical protein